MNKTIYDAAYRSMVAELRRGRDRRSLRQSDVAAMLGVSRQWVQKAETCQIRLDVMQVMHLCRLYGIDAPRLVRRVAEELSDEDAPFYLSGGGLCGIPACKSGGLANRLCTISRIGFAHFRIIPIRH